MKKKSFRLWTVLLSVFLMVTILPAVVYAGSGEPIEVVTQPTRVSGYAGEQKTMSVSATGVTSYHWQRRADGGEWSYISETNVNYSGAKTDSLTIKINKTTASFYYRCVLKNSTRSATSKSANVTLFLPPVITSQPKNISGYAGDQKSMSITDTGATAYQWQRSADGSSWSNIGASNVNYSGIKTNTLSIKINATTADFAYRCVAKNGDGSVASEAATILLFQPPVISSQPKNISGYSGEQKTMKISATSATAYQWQRSADGSSWSNIGATNVNYSGIKTNTLSIKINSTTSDFAYRCVAKNEDGSVESEAATITLFQLPTISSQPKNISGYSGDQKSMSISASNATSYQWQRSTDGVAWVNIGTTNVNYSGVKTETLTINIGKSTAEYMYRCVAKNSGGSAESRAASITLFQPPVISAQPKDVSGYAGDLKIMSVTVTGADTYQWQRSADGVTWSNIGATNVNYSGIKTENMTIKVSATSEGYLYRCIVKNSDGSVASAPAAVSMIRLPEIITQPATITGYAGDLNNISVVAANAASFQWQRSADGVTWTNIGASNTNYSGIKTDTLTVNLSYTTSLYVYRCVIKNAAGDILESNPAGIDVITVTYDANSGMLLAPDDRLVKTYKMYPSRDQIICASGDWDLFAEREGYTFAGWYYDKACTSQVWNFSPDKDTRIYAKWIKGNAAGVFFDAMGGSIVMGGDLYPVYSTLTERNKPFGHGQTAIKEGYKLVCWCLDMECTQAVEPYDYVVTDDVWFYARWAEAVKVTWNANGGIITEMNSATVVWTVFKDQAMGAEPSVQREGYTFGGWYLDAACTIPVDVYYFFIPTEDVTLYAKWT
ncbi:MAG: InlB B-repeat-containing protein [Clostridiales bacterium]|nr:InlB B-repeat-containing protein [Clostridiales bacterium]